MMRHGNVLAASTFPAERSHNESALRLCRLPCCLEDITTTPSASSKFPQPRSPD